MVAGSPPAALARLPARYSVRISHRRRDPIEYGFSWRSSTWLIDLDRVPTLPLGLGRLCRFDSADHLGDPATSLRVNLDAYLADHGLPAPARILMLANPRLFGYVFNPLSVFYCYDGAGRLSHVVAEVHNTYGGRHRYLVEPDGAGRAETAKAFYVSPFYPVDGEYAMRFPQPDEHLAVTITLHRSSDRPFVAVMTGERQPGAASLWRALRSPLATRAVMAGIRRHGIALYFKGLRPYARGDQPDVPTRAQPARTESGQGDSAEFESAQCGSAKSGSAQFESAQLESAQLESAQSRKPR